MENFKPIRILSEKDKEAIWALFEYVANEKEHIVEGYEKELRRVADIIELTPELFEEVTGLIHYPIDVWSEYVESHL